jgi:hypothetical protein
MKLLDFRVDCKLGEWHYITPLSDLHYDAASCDRKQLHMLLAKRDKLPNHRYIGIGDWLNLVVPKDHKRFNSGVPHPSLDGVEDYVNEAVAQVAELFEGRQIDFVGTGNHEASYTKYHGVDAIRMLTEQVGAAYGGYCGFARYRLVTAGHIETLTLLYHHGAWGGAASKGMPGFQRWASGFEGWDIALAGHNHYSLAHRTASLHPSRTGVKHRDKVLMFTGTHQRSYVDTGAAGSYEEIKGYAPTAVTAPLVCFKVARDRSGCGGKKWRLDTRVCV